MKTKLFIIIFWLLASGLWSMNIWGGWAEQFYKKQRYNPMPWFWMRILKIEQTEINCVLFVKRISMVGLALITIGTLAALLIL
jgi:hypothetical protein